MKQILILINLFYTTFSFAQTWAIDSDYSHASAFNPGRAHIISNNLNGYTYLGSFYSSLIPGQSPAITRIDQNGDVFDSRWYLSAHNTWFYAMEKGRNGDAFIAGHAYRNDLQKAVIAIAKLNYSDSIEWVIHIDAPNYSSARASAIAIDESGNVFVTGQLKQGTDIYGSFLIKVDKFSNVLWAKNYAGSWSYSLEYESGKLYRIHNDGPHFNAAVAAFDTLGSSLWVKEFDLKDVDITTELCASSQGLTIYVNPYDTVGFTPFQNTIIRTDLNGNLIDANQIGIECRSAVYFDDGSLAFVQSVADSSVLVKCDANLAVEWTCQLRHGIIFGKLRSYGEDGAFVWHNHDPFSPNTATIETISADGQVCDSLASPSVMLLPVACTQTNNTILLDATLPINIYNESFNVLPDTVVRSDDCVVLLPLNVPHEHFNEKPVCSYANGTLRLGVSTVETTSTALVTDISGMTQNLGLGQRTDNSINWNFDNTIPGMYVAQFKIGQERHICKFLAE